MKKNIFTLLIACSITTSHAGFDEGVAAHKAGNYQLAFKEYEPLAKQGDAQAQNNLAELIVYTPKGDKYGHILPNFVAYDPVRAFDLFRKAAKQGNADAQFNLGRFYMRGEPVPSRSTGSRDLLPDYAQAISWLSKAAEQGHTKALRQLGALYYNGKEVTQDYAQALSWFTKAAERGDADAQFNLGAMYFNGQGVIQDYSQAVSWYSKAATSTDTKISANAKRYLVLAQDKISVSPEKPQKIEKNDQQLLVIDSNKGGSSDQIQLNAKVMPKVAKSTSGSCVKDSVQYQSNQNDFLNFETISGLQRYEIFSKERVAELLKDSTASCSEIYDLKQRIAIIKKLIPVRLSHINRINSHLENLEYYELVQLKFAVENELRDSNFQIKKISRERRLTLEQYKEVIDQRLPKPVR